MNPGLLKQIAAVARLLKNAGVDATFVGGAILPMLVDPIVGEDLRPTYDIDVVVRASTYAEYDAQCAPLRSAGFRPGMEDGDPMCRYRNEEIVIDIMPVPFEGIGTRNQWFASVMDSAVEFALPSGEVIRIANAPTYLATKIEAFRSRGGNDVFGSKDLEDIVALLDGREELVDEITLSDAPLRLFLVTWSREFQATEGLHDILQGHVSRGSGPGRVAILLEVLEGISSLEVPSTTGAMP